MLLLPFYPSLRLLRVISLKLQIRWLRVLMPSWNWATLMSLLVLIILAWRLRLHDRRVSRGTLILCLVVIIPWLIRLIILVNVFRCLWTLYRLMLLTELYLVRPWLMCMTCCRVKLILFCNRLWNRRYPWNVLLLLVRKLIKLLLYRLRNHVSSSRTRWKIP